MPPLHPRASLLSIQRRGDFANNQRLSLRLKKLPQYPRTFLGENPFRELNPMIQSWIVAKPK